jgi:hypothetical protein
MSINWQHRATCLHCGYRLRELTKSICPECGQPFNPRDPRTMSVKSWYNPLDWFLLGPPGWVMHAVSAIVMIMLPIFVISPRTAFLGCAGVIGGPVVLFVWFVRGVAWIALRDYYGAATAHRRSAWHWLVEPLVVLAAVAVAAMLVMGW